MPTHKRKNFNEIEEKLRKLPLWKLIIFYSNMENKIIQLKKQGLSSESKKMSKERRLRSSYRNILLEQLTRWRKDPNSIDDVMDFSRVIENEKLKEIT